MTAAQVSQYAENTFFGKPCGLMDQTTCAYGGFVTIDFKDFADPLVRKVSFDFASCGHSLVIVDTGGNHADLTEDYAAVAAEMRAAAQVLGGRVLRDSDKPALLSPKGTCGAGDRAVLRPCISSTTTKSRAEVRSLESGDFPGFLSLVRESGMSSWTLLQNCYTTRNPGEQGIPLALALSAEILGSRGLQDSRGRLRRNHSGNVPKDLLDSFLAAMRAYSASRPATYSWYGPWARRGILCVRGRYGWYKAFRYSPGSHVFIVLKEDQGTEKLTEGVVRISLTNSQNHPGG
jgi:galactokinase